MPRRHSDRTLFEAALLQGNKRRATRLLQKLKKASEEPAEMLYDEARVCLLEGDRTKAIRLLKQMQKLDGAPYGTYRFLKAVCRYRIGKSLATKLLSQLEVELKTYRRRGEDMLPKRYYLDRIRELRLK